MQLIRIWIALALLVAVGAGALAAEPPPALPAPGSTTPLKVGSKRFTESLILGEIVTATASRVGPARHVRGLGNTAIVFEALRTGSIDVYVDYSGTIAQEILKLKGGDLSAQALRPLLAPLGAGIGPALGFENRYALAMTDAVAGQTVRISQLRDRPELRLGLSHEFLGRADGWPGLAAAYRLPQRPIGLDHGIAYAALTGRQVDVVDAYSTDAKIARYGLRVLDDDQHYFPRYDAWIIYRLGVPDRFAAAWAAISSLQGRIDRNTMAQMNAQAEIDGMSFEAIAARFIAGADAPRPAGSANASTSSPTPPVAEVRASLGERLLDQLWSQETLQLLGQHVLLVIVSVTLATLVAIPLGLVIASNRTPAWVGQAIMITVSVLQTIPSLALLAFLIPVIGRIGTVPTLIALFLYALLPIVRNTATGLVAVPQGLRAAASALGLRTPMRIVAIDLPLARPLIVAGIRTAAVISVATATIAAFIGAGGFGERIATGLALNDHAVMLAGALPAAALALLIDGAFELVERRSALPKF